MERVRRTILLDSHSKIEGNMLHFSRLGVNAREELTVSVKLAQ